MEFKFRSIHERSSTYFTRPPNLPPPRNFSFFTQQAIRAGFAAPAVDQTHREFHRNPNDFREAMQMQRELEKERIRAEIIAEEIVRRRILEEEVRREMMMERDFAMRFGSPSRPMRVDSRVPLLTNFEHRERFGGGGGIGVSTPHREMGFRGFETLPFQRDPVASGSGAGTRTRSSVTLQEIKTPPAQEFSKEKVIILAKPTITSAADLKRKAATQAEGATAELITSESKKQKTKDDWSCALCRISATSERGLKDHLQGKKHKARERGLVAQKTGFGMTPLPKKNTPTKSKHPKTPGLENSPNSKNKNEKPQGGKDEKKENSVAKKKTQKGAGPKKTAVTPKPKKTFKFWCEVCKVGTFSQNVLDAHKNGKRHLANLSEASKTGETKTNPSKTSMENAANEETKQERVEEKAEIEKGSVENNPTTTTDEKGPKVENNPTATTDEKGHKGSENVCADVTLVEDADNRVVPEKVAGC